LDDHELRVLKDALREHVNALAVDIGSRTPSIPDSLVRAGNYIHSVFEDAGLSVRAQHYQYFGQRVTNVLATTPAATGASAYYVVGAHYDTSQARQGQMTMRAPWR
jgi:acetylornithine deacetylase/succinyl-diaminopimelate desuccinylase-like protein